MDTSSCITSLRILDDIDALYVANAATTTMSEFTFWASDLGNYDLCMRFSTSEASMNPDMNVLRHCVAGRTEFKMTTYQSNSFAGICIPVACGPDELRNDTVRTFVIDHVNELLDNDNVDLERTSAVWQQQYQYFSKLSAILGYGASTEATYSCGANLHSMTVDRKVCMYIFGVLLFLTLISTAYHMSTAGRDGSDPWIVPERFALIEKTVVEAFSMIKNVPIILSIDSKQSSPDRFAVLDGLRVLSILWIVLAHTLALSTGVGLLNPEYVMPPTGFLSEWTSQLYFSARFAVDTFLFISGFLLVVSLLKRLDPVTERPKPRSNATTWVPMLYLHRLMRILPLYTFCLLLWWKIGVMLGSGPIWYHWEDYIVRCNSFWWTNLLFVNNLMPYMNTDTEECIYISWYLAVDMQCFILSPIFVLLYFQNCWLGLGITISVSIISSMAAFMGTFANNWSPHSFDGLWVTNYTIEVYTKPQYRISSYTVGMAAGMLWHIKLKRLPNFKFSNVSARVLMVTAIVILLYIIFCGSSAYLLAPCSYFQESTEADPCGSNWSLMSRAIYIGFTRLFWAISLAVIVLLSGNNQGEMVQGFLAHPLWSPFAKLTFAVYLLHIIILNVWYFSKGQKISFTQVDLFMSYAGVVIVSFFFAQIAMVLVESPSAKFAKIIELKFHCYFSGTAASCSGYDRVRNGVPTTFADQMDEVALVSSSIPPTQHSGESTTLLSSQQIRSI